MPNPFANWKMTDVEAHNARVETKRRSDFGVKRPRHKQTCKICSKEFLAPNSTHRKYCSPACAYSDPARAAREPKDRGCRICDHCKVEFRVHTGAPKARFCSRDCARLGVGVAAMRANRRHVPRSKFITKKCRCCDREFQSWVSSERVYCSNGCAAKETAGKAAATMHTNGHYVGQRLYSRCARGWRTIGNQTVFFRSSWEANYARFLQLLKESDDIHDWTHEPETFWFKGIKRGCCSYLPDFRVVQPDGTFEYHEVKGWMDRKSKTKIRRMAKYFPTVRLKVVDQVWFKTNAPRLSKIIPGWEKRSR